jgi:hypothetical protein
VVTTYDHSYQLNHDTAETWGFYSAIMTETGAATTHFGPGAAAGTSSFEATAQSPSRALTTSGINGSAVPIAAEERHINPAQALAFALLDQIEQDGRTLLLLPRGVAIEPRESVESGPPSKDVDDFDRSVAAKDDLLQRWNSDSDEAFACLDGFDWCDRITV